MKLCDIQPGVLVVDYYDFIYMFVDRQYIYVLPDDRLPKFSGWVVKYVRLDNEPVEPAFYRFSSLDNFTRTLAQIHRIIIP